VKKVKLRFVILIVPVLVGSFGSYAQSRNGSGATDPVRIGTVILNAGVGFGSDYKGDYYSSAFGTKIDAEWGLWQGGPGVITLGGEIGGSFSSGGYYYNYAARTEVVAVRSAWHYGWEVSGLDTYGGLSAGLGLHHFEYNNDIGYNGTEVIPVAGVFVGASYFVTSKFGFNVEAGYDITDIQVGIIFKLR
jgi:hypothetical protein